MSEYRDVLFKWAEQYLEAGAKVTDVRFQHDEGYYYSSLTYEDPYDEIVIYWIPVGSDMEISSRYNPSYDEAPGFGDLLRQLFEIAEREQND